MLVEAPHGRIAKEHTPAAVGLQAVLVRIDDDGIGQADGCVSPPRGLIQGIRNQREVTAVGRIHMDPEAIPLLERQNLSSGSTAPIAVVPNVATTSADIAFLQLGLERIPCTCGRDYRRDTR